MARRLSRAQIAAYVADQLVAGGDRAQVLREVAAYLVTNKMAGAAELLAADVALLLERRGVHVLAEVTVARPLSEQLAAAIKKSIGANVELTSRIDERILGGAIVRTPSAIQDASVRAQLRQLASM